MDNEYYKNHRPMAFHGTGVAHDGVRGIFTKATVNNARPFLVSEREIYETLLLTIEHLKLCPQNRAAEVNLFHLERAMIEIQEEKVERHDPLDTPRYAQPPQLRVVK